MLMDAWVQKHFGKPYDKDAAIARSGKVEQTLLKELLAQRYSTASSTEKHRARTL